MVIMEKRIQNDIQLLNEEKALEQKEKEKIKKGIWKLNMKVIY